MSGVRSHATRSCTLQTDDGFHVRRMRNSHGLEIRRQKCAAFQAKRVSRLDEIVALPFKFSSPYRIAAFFIKKEYDTELLMKQGKSDDGRILLECCQTAFESLESGIFSSAHILRCREQ